MDLSRPGLYTVQRVLGWHPLHVAAMSGVRGCLSGGCSRCCCSLLALLAAAAVLACCCNLHSLLRLTTLASRSEMFSLFAAVPCLPSPGNIELIRRLVEQFNCDLRVKSMNSWTPLHYAAAYNQVGAVVPRCALSEGLAVLQHTWRAAAPAARSVAAVAAGRGCCAGCSPASCP